MADNVDAGCASVKFDGFSEGVGQGMGIFKHHLVSFTQLSLHGHAMNVYHFEILDHPQS